jgi:murein tripeptide amidase MpaA
VFFAHCYPYTYTD